MKIRSFRYLVGEGFKNIWANRLMSLASIGVLIACMLIMGVSIILSLNSTRRWATFRTKTLSWSILTKSCPTRIV